MIQKSTEPQLVASDLAIGYHEKTILKALNLSIQAGEFICLLGPNGTGKSTLIRTLSGMQSALAGHLKFKDKDYRQISPRERARLVSIVVTEALPFGMMDVYSFVSLGRHPYSGWMGGLSETDHAKIAWALKAVGAHDLSERQLTELSDGERQKISVARALAQEARLMLLDEPTAYLDLPRRVELMQILRNLSHQQKIGMLLSTHDLEQALRYADRLWLITADGELIQGLPEELALNGDLERAFQTENLRWDVNTGSFLSKPSYCLLATVEGSGPTELWTRRSLERIGCGITNDSSQANIQVKIVANTNRTEWIIQTGNIAHTVHSINEVVNWVRNSASNEI